MNGGGDAECGQNIWVRKVDKMAIDKNSESNNKAAEGEETSTPAKTVGTVEALEDKTNQNPNTNGGDEKEDVEYRYINLGAKNTASMKPGERIIVYTPGGGGWGAEGGASEVKEMKDPKHAWRGGSIAERQNTAEASV